MVKNRGKRELGCVRVFNEAQSPSAKSMGIRDGTGEQRQKRNGRKSDVRDPMTRGDGTYGGGGGNRLFLFACYSYSPFFFFFFFLNGKITVNGCRECLTP